jgi:mono/diheme cytochrome c family protein
MTFFARSHLNRTLNQPQPSNSGISVALQCGRRARLCISSSLAGPQIASRFQSLASGRLSLCCSTCERTRVTEIPEHLLKRSRERRSALGLGGEESASEGASSTPSTATPAVAASSTPAAASGPAPRGAAKAPAAPPPPQKVHPTVIAAKSRRKIPFWAMLALSLLPVWMFLYARSLTLTAEASEGPLGLGAEVYSNCASCHGGAGGGGVGYQFSGGEVLKSYPHIEDQIRYVYYGTGAYNIAGVTIPGNPDREGGPHITGALGNMPQFGSSAGGALTDYQLLSVVCHVRYTLGGADPTSDEFANEFATWCSEDSEIFTGLQGGAFGLRDVENFVDGLIPIGMEPAAGSAPGDR